MIHPLFRLYWVQDHEKRVRLCALMRCILKDIPVDTSPEEDLPTPAASKKSLFWRYEQQQKQQATSSSSSLYSTWEKWCSEPQVKSVPHQLQEAFVDYNTTLPSSAAVERLFSLGKRVLSPFRSCLSDEHFEQIVILSSLDMQESLARYTVCHISYLTSLLRNKCSMCTSIKLVIVV